MTVIDEPIPPPPPPDPSERLAVSTAGDGFAYVPGNLIVTGRNERNRVLGLLGRARGDDDEADGDDVDIDDVDIDGVDDLGEGTFRIRDVGEVLAFVEEQRARGHRVQPEHVFVAHGGCGGGCGPHPAQVYASGHGVVANPMYANPMYANPMYANPMYANPMYANPMYANPMYGNPFLASLYPRERPSVSTAVPASPVEPGSRTDRSTKPTIVVLDTGLAGGGADDELDVTGLNGRPVVTSLMDRSVVQRPELVQLASFSAVERITGAWDVADMPGRGPGPFTPHGDGYLDPVAGHGTFIAGLVEQLVPGCSIVVQRVVDPFGYVDEGDLIVLLNRWSASARTAALNGEAAPVDIVSMSLGGHLSDQSFELRLAVARAIRAGIVLVASAGNEGSCIPNYPAAFDDVIAVGAVGPNGPAPWSNFGSWVDACAPGVDLVSAFFGQFDGAFPMMNGIDPDRFDEWARWSGTSFAAPVVVAALAREMVVRGCDAPEAVDRVIRARHLMRIPCLGTVVNI